MELLLWPVVVGAIVSVLTQAVKHYVAWAKSHPKATVVTLSAVGAFVAFKLIAAAWALTFVAAVVVAFGAYALATKEGW